MNFLLTQQRGQVLLITINRPEALNALCTPVLEELDGVFSALPEEVRAVVLTGAGEKAFVAGADIAEMAAFTKVEAGAFSRFGNGVFHKIATCPVPVIAAVNGFALGGGCELALACDIRYASERASFGQPEVGLGVTAGFGGTQRLARLIGPGKAKELLFTGERIKAEEALSIGLVNRVFPGEELLDKALEAAEKIARNAPKAVSETKLALNEGLEATLEEGLAIEVRRFASCFEREDQKEAMAAYLDKRKPAPFSGK